MCFFFSRCASYFTEQILTLSSLFPLLCRRQQDLCMGKWHQRTVSGFLNEKPNLPAQILQLFCGISALLRGFHWPRFWQTRGRQMERFLNPRSSFWWRARRNESATLDDGRNRLSITFGWTNQISWARATESYCSRVTPHLRKAFSITKFQWNCTLAALVNVPLASIVAFLCYSEAFSIVLRQS